MLATLKELKIQIARHVSV